MARPLRRRPWDLPERSVTPASLVFDRRSALGGLALLGGSLVVGSAAALPRNPRYSVDDRPITEERLAARYNNFFEFGSHKQIWKAAEALTTRPWTIRIEGLVEKELTLDLDALLAKVSLEERVYRLRCVEAWSMVIPWTGFPMAELVALARPLGSAKYVEMKSFFDPKVAPNQRAFWFPWPYTEGLTIEEATNELAFLATGAYGKPLPRSMGAPLRLAVPWKYGFKSIKSIVSFRFTEQRPRTFWEEVAGDEYGFWANVHPNVPHPRWSQEMEQPLGESEKIPTRIFNGYGEWVAHLYPDPSDPVYFR
ncbi:MAG: protein-methionine-sulfoxide reductase catalytic subunit MsrP [Geminicoccaceae bacterium]|nr:protein-methionine-sulfoxide reductase catalytic subunit MsrP [Geminicoccaceae bacterium]MDW8125112.1 protein-methionine-sulfoxide reductase catalytic subunit MsrP [Geminicoccaceae bacterium]